jgi:hypothetical protein
MDTFYQHSEPLPGTRRDSTYIAPGLIKMTFCPRYFEQFSLRSHPISRIVSMSTIMIEEDP